MSRPVSDPLFWAERIDNNARPKEIHRTVYECTLPVWEGIERRHKQILSSWIKPFECVLDAGCAYGRILDLMPVNWKGDYLGIDCSPAFIAMAKERHPSNAFMVADLRQLGDYMVGEFDWAIVSSVKQMITDAAGVAAWAPIEVSLKRIASRVLILEYDAEGIEEVL